MDLALQAPATLPLCKFRTPNFSYSNVIFISRSDSQTPLPQFFRETHSRFHVRASNSSFRTRSSVFKDQLVSVRVSEDEFIEEDETDGEGTSSSYSDDDSSFLSLNEKPDRNLTLLDDYEMEELGYTGDRNHRSGYAALVGKPNVGKSTLVNQLIGQKLSIVTDKPQTTRHRILGICSGPEYQVILYDTPGVIEKKMHKLDSMMMKNVRSAAINADCVLVVVDACKAPQKIDEVLEEGVGDLKEMPPTLLVLNKKDLIKPGEIAKKLEWYEKFTNVDEVIPVSAKYGHGIEDVKEWILSKLPVGPAYYPKFNKGGVGFESSGSSDGIRALTAKAKLMLAKFLNYLDGATVGRF